MSSGFGAGVFTGVVLGLGLEFGVSATILRLGCSLTAVEDLFRSMLILKARCRFHQHDKCDQWSMLLPISTDYSHIHAQVLVLVC